MPAAGDKVGARSAWKARMRTVDKPTNIGIVDHCRYLYTYDGSPNGALTGELCGLCWDYTNLDGYINTDGGTTWTKCLS